MSTRERWFRKPTPDGSLVAVSVDPDLPFPICVRTTGGGRWLSEAEAWALWAALGSVLTEEPPAWAVGRIRPTDVDGNPIEEVRDV